MVLIVLYKCTKLITKGTNNNGIISNITNILYYFKSNNLGCNKDYNNLFYLEFREGL